MNCADVRKHLNQLVEERDMAQLSPQLHRHLKECAACRGEVDTAKEMIRLMVTMPRVNPSLEFSAAWRSRIRQEVPAGRGIESFFACLLKPSLRPVLGAVLVVAVSLSFYQMVFTNRQPASLVSQSRNTGQSETAILKSTATNATGLSASNVATTYQLKIEQTGPKSKEIQKIIRNFTNSHEGGYALSYREQRDNLMVFNGLNRTEARELQKKLEQAGAVVSIAAESK